MCIDSMYICINIYITYIYTHKIYIPVLLYVCKTVYLSICLLICPSVSHLSIHIHFCQDTLQMEMLSHKVIHMFCCCYRDLQSVYTNLLSHHKFLKVLASLHPWQLLTFGSHFHFSHSNCKTKLLLFFFCLYSFMLPKDFKLYKSKRGLFIYKFILKSFKELYLTMFPRLIYQHIA